MTYLLVGRVLVSRTDNVGSTVKAIKMCKFWLI